MLKIGLESANFKKVKTKQYQYQLLYFVRKRQTMKKRCIDEDTLWEFIDGEVQLDQREELEQHFNKCPECKEELRQLLSFDDMLADTVQLEPSLRFSKNIMERIEIELSTIEYKPLLKRFWRGLAISVFATMLSAFFSVAIFFPAQDSAPFQRELNNAKAIGSGFLEFFNMSSSALLIFSILTLWGIYLVDKFLISKLIRG